MMDDSHTKRRNVLEPPGRWPTLRLEDLWSYRELLYVLAWRDVQVRYKQAALGGVWAVLQPVVMMAIYTFVFSRIANVATPEVPYPVFAYTGLIAWTLFASAVGTSANSIVGNANLVSKVNSPSLLIPVGAVLTWAPDFVISSLVLFVIMGIYGITPAWTAVFLPCLMLAGMIAACSLGVGLSALNVAYRDVRYIVPFLMQVMLFTTPVAYPTSSIPQDLRWLAGLNPMSWVVDFSRWIFLGTPVSWSVAAMSLATTLVLTISGLYYFRRVEHFFADVI
jgi:lipopolysaccharide transport system permease protein